MTITKKDIKAAVLLKAILAKYGTAHAFCRDHFIDRDEFSSWLKKADQSDIGFVIETFTGQHISTVKNLVDLYNTYSHRKKSLDTKGSDKPVELTETQKNILKQYCEGFSLSEIARACSIKETTVKSHLVLIKKQLDIKYGKFHKHKQDYDLLRHAIKLGLVKPIV